MVTWRWCHAAILVVLQFVLGFATLGHAQTGFYLKAEDRVVFYGDSITQQAYYPAFVETYVTTHYPQLNVRFIDSGWAGDRVDGGFGGAIDQRLARDVIAYRPTVVTVMLGMNDGRYQKFDPALFATYCRGYRHLLDSLQSAPSPFDDVTWPPQFEGGYNSVLIRYGQYVHELAEQRHFSFVDMNAPLVATLRKANATNHALAQKIIDGRIHPGEAGHLIMAEALLKSWHASPVVSTVEIDAKRGRVAEAENARISGFDKESLSWVECDDALPLPIDWNDPVVSLAARSSDVIDSLDQQILKVKGLTASRYTLKIDGKAVGTWSRDEWQRGVNLASVATPMTLQALDVYHLALRHYERFIVCGGKDYRFHYGTRIPRRFVKP